MLQLRGCVRILARWVFYPAVAFGAYSPDMATVLRSWIDHIAEFSRFSAPINADMIASLNTIVLIIVKIRLPGRVTSEYANSALRYNPLECRGTPIEDLRYAFFQPNRMMLHESEDQCNECWKCQFVKYISARGSCERSGRYRVVSHTCSHLQ